VDLGTGDGAYVRAAAEARPGTFFIGLDADASRMREVSRRCARALFVVAAVEAPPCELAGRAAELTAHFPWGSLLRGVVGLDERVLAGIAALARPGAAVRALVSVAERDPAALAHAMRDAHALARRYAEHGLTLRELRVASAAEVAGSRSSWAKRLRAGSAGRPAWLIRAEREDGTPALREPRAPPEPSEAPGGQSS
jgi:hypothetical protein